MITKKEFFNTLINEYQVTTEFLVNCLCDYLDSNVLTGLVEHIKEEF